MKNPERLQVPDGIVYIKPDSGPDWHVSTAVAQFYRTSRNRVAERIFVYVHLQKAVAAHTGKEIG